MEGRAGDLKMAARLPFLHVVFIAQKGVWGVLDGISEGARTLQDGGGICKRKAAFADCGGLVQDIRTRRLRHVRRR